MLTSNPSGRSPETESRNSEEEPHPRLQILEGNSLSGGVEIGADVLGDPFAGKDDEARNGPRRDIQDGGRNLLVGGSTILLELALQSQGDAALGMGDDDIDLSARAPDPPPDLNLSAAFKAEIRGQGDHLLPESGSGLDCLASSRH